jgi:hypothetical protein
MQLQTSKRAWPILRLLFESGPKGQCSNCRQCCVHRMEYEGGRLVAPVLVYGIDKIYVFPELASGSLYYKMFWLYYTRVAISLLAMNVPNGDALGRLDHSTVNLVSSSASSMDCLHRACQRLPAHWSCD